MGHDWFNLHLATLFGVGTFDIAAVIAILAIALALAFDFVNGFHDTANAVATVIYTRALKPSIAITMSGILNFAGAVCVGTAVAKVITKIIPQDKVSLTIVVAVLIGALVWNVVTWAFGLPVSSSHCLIASLFGAGIAAWGINGVSWGELNKVLLALIISPIAGFVIASAFTWLVLRKSRDAQPRMLRWMQVFSSAAVSFTHGSNDGQKTMGIIALILATQFHKYGFDLKHVPLWVIVSAALAIGLGTTIGGWRIIRTVGARLSHEKLTFAQGFGAEFSTACIIYAASLCGAPISTTHVLTSAVAGGTLPAHGIEKVNLKTMYMIVSAWILTLPVVAALSGGIYCVLRLSFR